eukprot:GHVR01020657.1.p1 GENE.GHVR01020657.1~~GHVR01020657.1.p1  ORF type:complete len:261 (-),score=26.74 GHVR01020657.1:819-1601(-)
MKKDSSYRVPPLMLESCMRGGKTTVLGKLFDELKTRGKGVIYINFNGNGIIQRKTNDASAIESVSQCLFRAIAIALMPPDKRPTNVEEANGVSCSKDELKNALLKAVHKSVVLLIDELNALLPMVPAHVNDVGYIDLGTFLREEFLDKSGRYLVFSTHYAVGTATDVLTGTSIHGNRDVLTATMPQAEATTEGLKALRLMSSACENLTPCEAAFYSYVPSLIFCVKMQSFNITNRFCNLLNQSIKLFEKELTFKSYKHYS